MKNFKNKKGFTLLEILLVVGIISILAGIVIIAINPSKQLADARNAQRKSDVLTILNAVYQYLLDPGHTVASLNEGTGLSVGDVCSSGTDAIDMTPDLVGDNATYLVSVPLDPIDGVAGVISGYYIVNNTNGRITVCAPTAELSATIEVTR